MQTKQATREQRNNPRTGHSDLLLFAIGCESKPHVRVFDSPVLSGVFGLIAPRSAAQRNDQNPSGRPSGRHGPMLYSWHGQFQWPRIMLPVTDTMSLPITCQAVFTSGLERSVDRLGQPS